MEKIGKQFRKYWFWGLELHNSVDNALNASIRTKYTLCMPWSICSMKFSSCWFQLNFDTRFKFSLHFALICTIQLGECPNLGRLILSYWSLPNWQLDTMSHSNHESCFQFSQVFPANRLFIVLSSPTAEPRVCTQPSCKYLFSVFAVHLTLNICSRCDFPSGKQFFPSTKYANIFRSDGGKSLCKFGCSIFLVWSASKLNQLDFRKFLKFFFRSFGSCLV